MKNKNLTTDEILEHLRELLHKEDISDIDFQCCFECIKDIESGKEPNRKLIESLLN